MAGTILVREALRRACYLLGDLSPVQFQRHRETELVDFLNDGALAIVSYLPTAGARLDTVKLKPGTLQSIESIAAADCKPADGSTPVDPVLGISFLHATRNRGSNGLGNGRALRVVDRKMLDAADPDWHSTSKAKTEVSAYIFDPVLPKYFWVTPPVSSSTQVWLEIAHNAQPIKVPNTGAPGTELYLAGGASTTKIPLPDIYLDDLVNYVVARANMNHSEWADADKASHFTALFTASLNAKVAAATGSNPNLRRLPFAPEPVGAAT
jgi:hypothetical protein